VEVVPGAVVVVADVEDWVDGVVEVLELVLV
jgi:hypothetical protein